MAGTANQELVLVGVDYAEFGETKVDSRDRDAMLD